VDRRVGMIEGNGVDAVEERQIVFVRRIVTMPCDDIERRVIDERRPQASEEFCRDVKLSVPILEGCDRCFEIARIGQAIGSYRAKFGKAKRKAIVLADVSACLILNEHDAELDPSRDDADFAGSNRKNAEFSVEAN